MANLKAAQTVLNELKEKPSLIHDSKYAFVKQFLEEFKIPDKEAEEEPVSPTTKGKKGAKKKATKSKAKSKNAKAKEEEPKKKEEPKPKKEEPKKEEPKKPEPKKEEKEDEEEEEEVAEPQAKKHEPAKEEPKKMEVEEEPPEEEKPQVESDPVDEDMHKFPPEKEDLTDSELEKVDSLKSDGRAALGSGDYKKALELLTKALQIQSGSSMLIADRSRCWLKLKKPNNAIKDADRAISINPDSSKGFRIRGQARVMLGQIEKGHEDLCTANRIDYDEDTYELIKTLQPKVDKIRAYRTQKERKDEEKRKEELIKQRQKQREEELKKQQDEEAEAMAGGGGGEGFQFPGAGGGGPGGFDFSQFAEMMKQGGRGGGRGGGFPGGFPFGAGGPGGGAGRGTGGARKVEEMDDDEETTSDDHHHDDDDHSHDGHGHSHGPGGHAHSHGGPSGGGGGGPSGGGLPKGFSPDLMAKIVSDPDFKAAMGNPKLQGTLQKLMKDPSSIKDVKDPEILKLVSKFKDLIPGMSGGGGSGGSGAPKSEPSKGSGPSTDYGDDLD